MDERVKSGIPGLDKIIGGGIPSGQVMLLTGTAGTGKTTLCSQFIYSGIKNHKENGVYLSLEDPVNLIKQHSKAHGWDLEPYEKAGRFAFIKYDPYHIEDILEMLESSIREVKARRVVVDSVSALGLHIKDSAELRRMIFGLSLVLRRLGCTSILCSEMVHGKPGISRYGVEEFVADSVVVLYYKRVQSTFNRAIQVWKVAGSSHSDKLHPYIISKKGIAVSPDEEAAMGN